MKALIVDDEATVRNGMRKILADSFAILEASNRTSARRLSKDHLPDIILLDQFTKRYQKVLISIAGAAMGVFMRYSYPGHVRQLRNVPERLLQERERERDLFGLVLFRNHASD